MNGAARIIARALAPAAQALVLLALLFAPIARAQQGGEQSAQYQQLVADAVNEMQAGRFMEARALFLQAHEIYPNARTFRGLAMVSFELRQYPEVIRYSRQAIESQERPLDGRLRGQVQELSARAARFVGVFHPRFEPADATLFVDGEAAALEPDGTVLLGLGQHAIVVRAPGFNEARTDIEVRGGEEASLVVQLQPLMQGVTPVVGTVQAGGVQGNGMQAPGVQVTAPPMGASMVAAPQPRNITLERVDGVRMGAGVALVVLGGVAVPVTAIAGLIWALDDDSIHTGFCEPDCTSLVEERDIAMGLTIAGMVTVGVGLIAGGILVGTARETVDPPGVITQPPAPGAPPMQEGPQGEQQAEPQDEAQVIPQASVEVGCAPSLAAAPARHGWAGTLGLQCGGRF